MIVKARRERDMAAAGPRVSVIVPVYNVERYLAECLDSLVNQTMGDIEIIAVNDASPDGSLDILRDYALRYPNKIVVIDSPVNRCLGGARNLGLQAANGEYVGFVDSDDRVDPQMYEKLYTAAKSTGADIVDCDFYEFTASGGGERRSIRTSATPELCGVSTDDARRGLILNPGLFHTKIVRRELFTKYDIRFPERMFFEDIAISLMFAMATRIQRVHEPLYHYRVNPTSITRSRNSAGVFDRLLGADCMLANAEEWGLLSRFRPEVEALYVEEYYAKTLAAVAFTLDRPPLDRLLAMRSQVRERFPDFKRNIHYARLSMVKRLIVWLNEVHPGLFVWVARGVRFAGLSGVARNFGRASRNGIAGDVK